MSARRRTGSAIPSAVGGPVRPGGELAGAGDDRRLPGGGRHHLVDQPPLDRAAATHALLQGAEHVRPVAPDAALVGQPREATGAGQHGEQRHLGQRDRAAAVVHQHDVVRAEGELVAAAGARTVYRSQVRLARVRGRVLDRQARLVGELAEIDLLGVAGLAEHADVRSGAEHVVLARAQHHTADLRVLEAQPLHRVGEFDVHAEVVGVELQLDAGKQAAGRIDVHDQVRDRPFQPQSPVSVAPGLRAEIHLRTGHVTSRSL